MTRSARSLVRRAALNEHLVRKCFADILPRRNGFGSINYPELIEELRYFRITNVKGLRRLLQRHRRKLVEIDGEPLDLTNARIYREELGEETFRDKLRRNYWFSWEGLTRIALELEFGDRYREYAQTHHLS